MMPEVVKIDMYDIIDAAVKQIAVSRKVTEILCESVEVFDEELNNVCEKWHEHFKDMDEADISDWLIEEMIMMEMGEKHGNK